MRNMRILVCGSRTWESRLAIRKAFSEIAAKHVVLIHGACRGADKLAAAEARFVFGWDVVPYVAEWRRLGKAAGPERNARMLRTRPDLVIAFRAEGKSDGTDDMICRAEKAGIPVRVVRAA